MGDEVEVKRKKKIKWDEVRVLVSFWILGMCNNFGYVVMLSAAHDLLHKESYSMEKKSSSERLCNEISTGAILLADILPSVLVKLISPFFPLWINARMVITILFSIAGYALVASRINSWLVIGGVIFTSISSGVGESSLLMYLPYFRNKNVISTWSSGTGGAGVLGSLSYLGLTSAGVSPELSIYIMLVVPVIMGVAFWALLKKPKKIENTDEVVDYIQNEVKSTVSNKCKLILKIALVYMLPFGMVYLFEYFINQGLSELIYFENIFIDPPSQYRWYSFDYQIGVLISRSSVNILRVNNTWMLAFLQGLNVIVMTTEAVFRWIGSFWVILIIILWEGLLGGCSYVNTYRRINEEIPPDQRQFSMSMNSFGDAIGITVAGFISIPVHNAICRLPPP